MLFFLFENLIVAFLYMTHLLKYFNERHSKFSRQVSACTTIMEVI